jgi:hypothetical protein
MSRRPALPGASELFRTTSSASALAEAVETGPPQPGSPDGETVSTSPGDREKPAAARAHRGPGRPSGRQRHDEKITVYLSSDELVALDEAKSTLYRDLGLKVDRGRIVREAVSVVVADLAAKGEASIVARRLREG